MINNNCNWTYSKPLYIIQSLIYITFCVSLIYKNKNRTVNNNISIFSIIKVLLMFIAICVGYIIDTFFTSIIDIGYVGKNCAFLHFEFIMNYVNSTLSILIFFGWKIILFLMLFQNRILLTN